MKNQILRPGWRLAVVASDPATPASGDPVRYGPLTGVAVNDEGDGTSAATETVVDFGPAVYDLTVKAVDGSGNSAIAVGDTIFYVDADTPKLSKKATGYFFGFADQALGSGQTGTIRVIHNPSPGAGTLATGGVGTTQLATAAVTAAKLTTTLATGHIPLDLFAARLIGSNDIPVIATTVGGLLTQDTAPSLKRVNAATDKMARIAWAASSNIEIQFPNVILPADLDDTADMIVKLYAAMNGGTDTPTIAVSAWFGVGDANAGGNTAAVTGTTPAVYSATLAAADVPAAPVPLAIGLTPAAHTTNIIYLYSAWIEYTRK